MALKDRIRDDITRVFLNMGHFAETHAWNGREFTCVIDEEANLKRKNNNVNDVSWDANTREKVLYAKVEGFPGKVIPNASVVFDKESYRVLEVQEDMGMYTIKIQQFDPREMSY